MVGLVKSKKRAPIPFGLLLCPTCGAVEERLAWREEVVIEDHVLVAVRPRVVLCVDHGPANRKIGNAKPPSRSTRRHSHATPPWAWVVHTDVQYKTHNCSPFA